MKEEMLEKNYGLVLAGGGGKGAYQIGAYKALMEYGLDKHVAAMAGTSVGTLNMALLAMNDMDLAESVWKGISPNQFLEAQIDKILDGKEGFISRNGLVEIIDSYINREKLLSDTRPMYATISRYADYVTEVATPEYVKLNELDYDSVKQIMLASSALPIVYEPVKIGNYVYRDGGLTDNLPITPLYENEGIRDFIVIMLSPNTGIPYEKYPGSTFIEIRPQASLGDLFTGTLDFSGKGAIIRMQMGYVDCKRVLKYYGEELMDTPGFKLRMMEIAVEEYRQIGNTYHVDEVRDYIDNTVSNINSYFNKYDIDLDV